MGNNNQTMSAPGIGSISPQIFDLISPQMFDNMSVIWNGLMEHESSMVMSETRFLKLFLTLCLERWDFTGDEQSSERLRCMVSAFEVIWIKEEYKGQIILYRASQQQQGDIEELPSLIFQLERRINQSKLLIEEWCGILMPLLMQSKPTLTIDEEFLILVHINLSILLSRKGKEIVPSYIGILFNMICFLQESLKKVEDCIENKNCIEFLNFASAFSNKAACLTCLYWAKEASIIEQSILFYMLMLEFIPCALNVTSCYFDNIIQCSTENFQSILLEETVESFVEFFFGHLETTLEDDFPILRDQLIYIFTFMTDNHHPCDNAVEEDIIIRSQIYALFREDVYLLLSVDEIKVDFSNNNIILRDFINKIEIANANIRQRYYAFSYSWIGSEAVKIDYLYFVLIKKRLIKRSPWPLRDKLRLYLMELGLLRVSLLWFATMDDGDEEIRSRLNSVIISLHGIWGQEEEKGFLAVRLLNDEKGNMADWHMLAFELEGKIELSKLEISTQLMMNGLYWSHRSKPSTSNKVLKFLESIHHNLNSFVSCRASKIMPFIQQIETLKDKLTFMRNIMKLVENCMDGKNLGEFIMFVQVFANEAAYLTILYWIKEANDKTATEINLILSHMLHRIRPTTADVARLYFETFTAIYVHRSDPLLFGHTASIFADFLLEDPMTLFKDDFQILRDDVIFLLTFLNDHPDWKAEELFSSQIENYLWEDVYGLLPVDDMKGDISQKVVRLRDFMIKIQTTNAEIRKLHCEFPDSSLIDLPKIMSPWYLDFLLQNLRNLKERMITDHMFVLFMKFKIVKLEEELVSLSPFFSYIIKLQNEQNATWLQVVDLLHLTEHVINSCIRSWFVFDHPIWYYMAYLSDVIDRMKAIKTKLAKIKENNFSDVGCLPHSNGVIRSPSKQAWISEINELVVGFEDESKILIDNLTRGNKSLDIVSIVGMGGLGKTTLARKVSSSVKEHFHILAFYTVSQDHNPRMLLLGILNYILVVDDKICRMSNDDLAHKLWQCLSHKMYLIVLDDVWHTSVWNEVKRSLPDDKNGSRVMITTRFYDVAYDCKMKCSPFEMPFMSEAESWELLQKKVFQNGISPPNLYHIGRQISESCKGLPLSIVVIAGLLARKERSPSSWSEVAERLFFFLSDEGCVKILELSYNHLPEYLKPCLLYLGAFPEDKLLMVNQITRLWIAEGFVHDYETKSVEDVAREYIQDLVDRSLVIVSSRGSGGEIKTISVHDLIHKLCQIKCHEKNFFKLVHGIAPSCSMYDHYRVSIGSSSLENASSLLLFTHQAHDFPIKTLKLAQVLYVETKKESYESFHVNRTSVNKLRYVETLVNLRHVENDIGFIWLPSSISNLWNIQSLILTGHRSKYLPETLWKMKSLKHVEVRSCVLQLYDSRHERLDKVVSFSWPRLCSGKDVEQLQQRLPAVRKLRIVLVNIHDSDDNQLETLDFYRKLESLKLHNPFRGLCSYLINFPSTLTKLTIAGLRLHLTTILSNIAELHHLRVLKLRYTSITGPILEMEGLVFNHLVFFELVGQELVQWNASTESFPCLEQLSIECCYLEELPSCFGEISTLKRIAVGYFSGVNEASALRIQEEHVDLGNKVEVTRKRFKLKNQI